MMDDTLLARKVFGCIDNTSLGTTDTDDVIIQLCNSSMAMRGSDFGPVAAVCVYPRYVALAKRLLAGSSIRVATVAGAFPHGQVTTSQKVAEVQAAIASGADEVDVVICRASVLSGDLEAVQNEVSAMKEACGDHVLKVILETGELCTAENISNAARMAIMGGADFVKTSTGKSSVGATIEAAEAILRAVAECASHTGRIVGFKAAGGIREAADALRYAHLAARVMGDDYVGKDTFRIGASSLTRGLYAQLVS